MLRRDALRQHRNHGIEFDTREVAVDAGASNEIEQIVLTPCLARGGRDNLLGHHITRPGRHLEANRARRPEWRAPAPRTRSARPASSRNSRPLGTRGFVRTLDLMTRAPDALQRHGDGAR